jgi:2,4-dienoyl-CoA reductase (NADPH2)
MRFPVEIVQQIREKVGSDFIIIYRLSMLDLIHEGSTREEVVLLGKAIEAAGANIINTGIGWHEARIPTIATMVPKAAFAWVTAKIRKELSIPLVTTNRINEPSIAEEILANGQADMISMARPFLADPEIVLKAEENRSDEINICIACNQACLDHVFERKRATCLVNPRACYETELLPQAMTSMKNIAVIGAGMAGMSFALEASKRGHNIHLFEKNDVVGGQFNLAGKIPGKEDFNDSIAYFKRMLDKNNVSWHMNTKASADELAKYDEVVVASGVNPRELVIPGIDHPMVIYYPDLLSGRKKAGDRVAIIGAGGIAYDVAEYLTHSPNGSKETEFLMEWGIDPSLESRGGLLEEGPEKIVPERQVYMIKRSQGKFGKNLSKTTGWIHRMMIKKADVNLIQGVEYDKIDDEGLHLSVGDKYHCLKVDNVVICAGQTSNTSLYDDLVAAGIKTHLIGGARKAGDLDAKEAIREGTELGMRI